MVSAPHRDFSGPGSTAVPSGPSSGDGELRLSGAHRRNSGLRPIRACQGWCSGVRMPVLRLELPGPRPAKLSEHAGLCLHVTNNAYGRPWGISIAFWLRYTVGNARKRGEQQMVQQAQAALVSLVLLVLAATQAVAQGGNLQALARVDAARSSLSDDGEDVILRLGLSQPVPYRVFVLADPARVVVDFREVDWDGFDGSVLGTSARVADLRYGIFRPGWSRLVMEIDSPLVTKSAALIPNRTRGTADLTISLQPTSEEVFRAAAKAHEDDAWALPKSSEVGKAKPRQLGDRPIVVVLDPGHGGIDPGAVREGYYEKNLVLQFAKELQEALIRTGRYRVELTRTDDVFLSLPGRITRARELNADVFISLHADALAEGNASGITVYTLSTKASNAMAAELAESHDRSDLMAGVDLNQQDDQLAAVLMDLARLETDQRSDMLAEMLVDGMADAIGKIRKRPHLSAGFTVLKAPDIPSVLVELGFMSNRQDLSNLLTPGWREKVIAGITDALDTWTIEDAAQARLLRK